jgi:hypothetical protein
MELKRKGDSTGSARHAATRRHARRSARLSPLKVEYDIADHLGSVVSVAATGGSSAMVSTIASGVRLGRAPRVLVHRTRVGQ